MERQPSLAREMLNGGWRSVEQAIAKLGKEPIRRSLKIHPAPKTHNDGVFA